MPNQQTPQNPEETINLKHNTPSNISVDSKPVTEETNSLAQDKTTSVELNDFVQTPIYHFAADADVIIHLATIADGKIPRITNTEMIPLLQELFKQVYYGRVKLYVVPQTLVELGEYTEQYSAQFPERDTAKAFYHCAMFVKTFCSCIEVPEHQKAVFNKMCDNLAFNYCWYAGLDSQIFINEDSTIKIEYSKDVRALAQAAASNLCFLTCNPKDFCFTYLDTDELSYAKRDNIIRTNRKNHLLFFKEIEKGALYSCPQPVHVGEFVRKVLPKGHTFPQMPYPCYPATSIRLSEVADSKMMAPHFLFADLVRKSSFVKGLKNKPIESPPVYGSYFEHFPLGLQDPYGYEEYSSEYKKRVAQYMKTLEGQNDKLPNGDEGRS